MPRFPADAPQEKVIQALESLGFVEVRRGNHIAMERDNGDETKTPLTLPNHRQIKGATLRTILTQSGIARRFSGRLRPRLVLEQRGPFLTGDNKRYIFFIKRAAISFISPISKLGTPD